MMTNGSSDVEGQTPWQKLSMGQCRCGAGSQGKAGHEDSEA